MNGRVSKIAEKINLKYKDYICNLNKKGKSSIGKKFELDGKYYIVTDGELKINLDLIKDKLRKFN